MPIEVTYSGPFFSKGAESVIDDALRDVVELVANQGVNDVHEFLDSVLKNPTGNYERHIRTERQQNDLAVTDSGIVYGPWLEGVGSRNQTTRFKGYATFRKVTQTLDRKAGQIAEREIGRAVERLN
jgi:hypothetical protein